MTDRLGVTFQGTKTGLIIAIDESQPLDQLLQQLQKKLKDAGFFFADASATLSLGRRDVSEKDVDRIINLVVKKHGLHIEGVRTYSDISKKAAEANNLPVESLPEDEEKAAQSIRSQKPGKSALPVNMIRSTIRSGQIFESPGHLVVLGDVNPGAEIAAAGDIVVFGTLRGTAFAGATGREHSIIAALKLSGHLLRIADCVGRGSMDSETTNTAEFAFIENGRIAIDKWTNQNRLSVLAADTAEV